MENYSFKQSFILVQYNNYLICIYYYSICIPNQKLPAHYFNKSI